MNGQAKIDFEKWLFFNHRIQLLDGFTHLTKSCQNALIIEFFDSVGIYIDSLHSYAFDNTLEYCVKVNDVFVSHNEKDKPINRFKTRQEATEKAIEKAVEIYNNLK